MSRLCGWKKIDFDHMWVCVGLCLWHWDKKKTVVWQSEDKSWVDCGWAGMEKEIGLWIQIAIRKLFVSNVALNPRKGRTEKSNKY